MTDTLQKPSPVAVLGAQKQVLTTVKAAATEAKTAAEQAYVGVLEQISGDKAVKFDAATSARDTAIEASLKIVQDQAQVVAEARKALEAAEAVLNTTEQAHNKTVTGLAAAFNKAADDIRNEVSAAEKAAKLARQEALASERKKVAEARKAGRNAFVAETKALVDYHTFVVVDTTVRVGHGVAAVAKSLKTAFNTGYSTDSGVALPQSLLQRQQNQAPAAPAPTDTPQI